LQFLKLNANIAQGILYGNTGRSNYDALQLEFRRRFSHGLQAISSYTWSHSIDNASAGSTNNGANVLVPGLGIDSSRGSSDFDVRHTLSAAVTYQVPAPTDILLEKILLKDWSVENVFQARSGPPVNVNTTGAFTIAGEFTQVRPDVVPGVPFYLHGSQFPGGTALNAAAFSVPPISAGSALRQGNLGRNALRALGAWQWDFAIHRDFPIHDTLALQFRAEIFNILNHPNFGAPVANLANSQFGVATQMLANSFAVANTVGAGGLTPLYQIGGPRSVQLGLKLRF
jgi:hypothetical protein